MATSPLVPDIAPFLQSLQQFTPQARQNRAFQLAGLEQQQQIGSEQLQQLQTANRRAQIISIAEENRAELLGDQSDLNFVLKKGPEGLRNRLALLAKEKDPGSADLNELVQFANNAAIDADGTFKELTTNKERLQTQINAVNQILDRTKRAAVRVQSSDVLPDGTTVQVLTDGNTRVTSPQGAELIGQERADAIRTAQEFGVDIQAQRAGGRTEATKREQRASELITRGIAAAESTATVRRALTLLDRVKTGGPAAVSLALKQRLGIEGADEGELSNSLGKAVLSQLRETFGAAFTENEGLRLDRIEARFGKSVAANRRLLEQALRMAERTAKRARKTALERDDAGTVQDIDDLLTFTLDLEEPAAQVAPQAAPTAQTLTTSSGIEFTVQ